MSPHDALAKEIREWLLRARGDLSACSALIAADLPSEALFHAQQCAEKAIKALLTWNQVTFKKTHDLDELKQACFPFAGDATPHLTDIGKLSQYAWLFRYLGTPYAPERKEAEEIRLAAEELLLAISARLESQFGES